MTARPHFSESRRRPVCVAVGLCIVMVAVLLAALLAAGCINQLDFKNNTSNSTTIVTQSSPITQTDKTQCPPLSGNTTPYIIINPVNNHIVGDVFEINGTTNFRVTNSVKIDIYQSHFSTEPQNSPHRYTGLSKNVTIQDDNCGVNRWSFLANTSNLLPDEYIVDVTSVNPFVKNHSVFKLFYARVG
jgi:hypothetical protein